MHRIQRHKPESMSSQPYQNWAHRRNCSDLCPMWDRPCSRRTLAVPFRSIQRRISLDYPWVAIRSLHGNKQMNKTHNFHQWDAFMSTMRGEMYSVRRAAVKPVKWNTCRCESTGLFLVFCLFAICFWQYLMLPKRVKFGKKPEMRIALVSRKFCRRRNDTYIDNNTELLVAAFHVWYYRVKLAPCVWSRPRNMRLRYGLSVI